MEETEFGDAIMEFNNGADADDVMLERALAASLTESLSAATLASM